MCGCYELASAPQWFLFLVYLDKSCGLQRPQLTRYKMSMLVITYQVIVKPAYNKGQEPSPVPGTEREST